MDTRMTLLLKCLSIYNLSSQKNQGSDIHFSQTCGAFTFTRMAAVCINVDKTGGDETKLKAEA